MINHDDAKYTYQNKRIGRLLFDEYLDDIENPTERITQSYFLCFGFYKKINIEPGRCIHQGIAHHDPIEGSSLVKAARTNSMKPLEENNMHPITQTNIT